jgi:hypothetical protein
MSKMIWIITASPPQHIGNMTDDKSTAAELLTQAAGARHHAKVCVVTEKTVYMFSDKVRAYDFFARNADLVWVDSAAI